MWFLSSFLSQTSIASESFLGTLSFPFLLQTTFSFPSGHEDCALCCCMYFQLGGCFVANWNWALWLKEWFLHNLNVFPERGRRMGLETHFRNRCGTSFAKNCFGLNQILFSAVSIGFFDDIVIPPESLQQPAKLYPLITFDNFTTSFQKIVQCWPNRHSALQQWRCSVAEAKPLCRVSPADCYHS